MPQAIEWSFATPKMSAFLPVEQSHPCSSACDRRLTRPAQPTIGPMPRPTSPTCGACAGVRGFVLDADGVLVLKGEPIAGLDRGAGASSTRAGSRTGS